RSNRCVRVPPWSSPPRTTRFPCSPSSRRSTVPRSRPATSMRAPRGGASWCATPPERGSKPPMTDVDGPWEVLLMEHLTLHPWSVDDLPLLQRANTPAMTTHLNGPETDEQVQQRHE